jgi:hypothetical protein
MEMANNPLRVVVWATGGIGSIAIRAIQRRPDIELVGVWVHSEEKVGKDAGELANGEPIGLAATNDADALIGLKPDCVIYAASGPERDALAIPDYVKLLEAGINVDTTSTTRLVNPHAYEPAEWRDQLVAAAKQGQVSPYASGIEPGFAADYLPLVLSTQSSSIEKIHAFEIGLYDNYRLSVARHWPALVSVGNVGVTSTNPPPPKATNDDQLRTVCGPQRPWPQAGAQRNLLGLRLPLPVFLDCPLGVISDARGRDRSEKLTECQLGLLLLGIVVIGSSHQWSRTCPLGGLR